jgi:hypothetical protein
VTRADADELPVGNFRPTKVVVTLLDDDYQAVKNARRLRYNGDEYLFGYEPEASACSRRASTPDLLRIG